MEENEGTKVSHLVQLPRSTSQNHSAQASCLAQGTLEDNYHEQARGHLIQLDMCAQCECRTKRTRGF